MIAGDSEEGLNYEPAECEAAINCLSVRQSSHLSFIINR